MIVYIIDDFRNSGKETDTVKIRHSLFIRKEAFDQVIRHSPDPTLFELAKISNIQWVTVER